MSHENVLPKAVRDQIAQADKIYEEVYPTEGPKNPNDPPQGSPSGEEPNDPLNDPPAEPPSGEPSAEEPNDPPNDPPAEPPSGENWEHKFKVLQGKYDKEVPRLHRQFRTAKSQNQQLLDRVSQLEQTVKQLKETPPPAAEPDNPLTQEEITQFGPDLIDIIRRVAKAETGVALDEQLRPIKQTVEQVQEAVANPAESGTVSAEQVLADLAEAVPEWEKQNVDPQFLNWLDEKDPYSGKARTELIADAWTAGDSERVISLFKGFQKENAVVDPSNKPSNETPANDLLAEDPNPEQPLDELVAPGTPKTGSAGAQNESGKRIWTQKEIRQFYSYKNEFIKKNPEKELPEKVVLQERDIFAAQSEGRIRM